MKSEQITLKDIAHSLNTSPSTVSRALQDHPGISRETKKLVNEMAKKLKYRPNIVARGLKNRQFNTIGVIIPEIVHFFFSQVISGIEEVAYNEGFTVMICQSNERMDREINNVNVLMAHRVAGILVSVSKETSDFQHLTEIQKNGIPLVFFDRMAPGILADQVINNNREAAYQATLHLLEQGRLKIAHFAGPLNLAIARERKEGYLQALGEAGVTANPAWCIVADSFEKAFDEVLRLKQSGNMPDAIFCSNDLTAIGAMKSIQKSGLRIPQDVAVVGFSRGIFSEISNPSLSSVDQHGFEMGMIATQMLLKRIRAKTDDFPFVTKILTGELVTRDSSMS
jgi:DNA-binding LacI/PurR family transcriptional regulator